MQEKKDFGVCEAWMIDGGGMASAGLPACQPACPAPAQRRSGGAARSARSRAALILIPRPGPGGLTASSVPFLVTVSKSVSRGDCSGAAPPPPR